MKPAVRFEKHTGARPVETGGLLVADLAKMAAGALFAAGKFVVRESVDCLQRWHWLP